MAKKDLTQAEMIALIDARVTTLEMFTCATNPYFNEWVDQWIHSEVDLDTSLNTVQKDKIKLFASDIKTRFKKDK